MSLLSNKSGFITENFKISEMNKSSFAEKHKLINVATGYAAQNQQWLAIVLQLIRDEFGTPMTVTSGYRSEHVNKKVGGSPTSSHTHGSAADVKISGVNNDSESQRRVAIKIANFLDDIGIVYDQIIYYKSWVHVGMRFRSRGRRQFFAG